MTGTVTCMHDGIWWITPDDGSAAVRFTGLAPFLRVGQRVEFEPEDLGPGHGNGWRAWEVRLVGTASVLNANEGE